MAEAMNSRDRRSALVAVFALCCLGVVGCAQTGAVDTVATHPGATARIQSWEWWRDLGSISSVSTSDRVVMRSSHCPSGCEFDRHSSGDSRFIRINQKGEGVIFSTEGAGAVTRIWMVMGDGVSEPLDPSIRLRVRIDGRDRPVVDLPLPEVFDGSTSPFLAPLVAGPGVSGGGNVSYVPVGFRDGCEISLVGADDATIWFQVTARLAEDASSVRSFAGDEDLRGFRSVLRRVGTDPWQGAPTPTISGSAVLTPGGSKVIATLDGPDMLNGIIIRAAKRNWHRLGLRLTFDDREPQLIPLLDLFGVLNADGGITRSLLFGADSEDDLYCYFPMPYFESAKVELMRRPVEGPSRFKVEYAIRLAGSPPPVNAGYFRVQVRREDESGPGEGLTLLDVEGGGSMVGLVADLTRVDRENWQFLEGDERFFFDGESEPSWHGTGVEDLFNGGFFFIDDTGKPSSFNTALAGAPFVRLPERRAIMYRLFLGDAVVFDSGIRAVLETGPTGDLSIRSKTVAYYYVARRDVTGAAAVQRVEAP